MNKSTLIQYCDLQEEIKDLKKRIERIEKQSEMTSDVVQNGYKRHAVIYGIDITRKYKLDRYKSKLNIFCNKLFDLQNEIEDYIEKIEDSKTRQIFRYRYMDNMTWVQIANAMGYDGESGPRMKHDRFLEENL